MLNTTKRIALSLADTLTPSALHAAQEE